VIGVGHLNGPRLAPANGGKPKKLVILAHGYGSNGQDLIGLAPYFAKALPDAAFVAPDAPEPIPGYDGGYQWFPLSRLDPHTTAAGVRAAAPHLDRFIDAELKRHELPASACALVGFSQGTMMSLHVGLRRPEALGAVLGYSGMLAAPEALKAEMRSRPPVALVHGDRDDVIPVSALLMATLTLAEAGLGSLWRISRGAGHTIAPDGMELGAQFLRGALSGRFAGWAPPSGKGSGPA
jgi:phospholipase/carboxylesterase